MSDVDAVLGSMAHKIEALALQVTHQQQAMEEQQQTIAQYQQTMIHQQQELAQQQAELATLRAQVEDSYQASDEAVTETATSRQHRGGKKTSRRRLLQVGGAAAAAGVAVLATELAQPPAPALANGVAWQTGLVNADNETFVEPSNGSFPDPTLLTVRVGTAAPLDGLTGANSAAIAAYDTTGSGAFAIYATSSNGTAVHGVSANGPAVFGDSANGPAVFGDSPNGVGGSFGGGRAPLQLGMAGAPGAPTIGFHGPGDIWLDSSGTLWICTNSGIPGTWVRLPSVLSSATGGAINYLPKPIRLLDSRSGATDALNNGGGPFASGSTHSLTIAGVTFNSVTVPAGAVGAIGNVTVVSQPSANGFLALVPHGVGFSGTAVLAYASNQTVSNNFNVGLASGALDIIVGGTGSTDVILDVFAVVA